jgi:hypothetical protein
LGCDGQPVVECAASVGHIGVRKRDARGRELHVKGLGERRGFLLRSLPRGFGSWVGFENYCHSRAQQPNHRARRTRACCALCLRASHTLNHGHEDKATLGYVERQQDTWVGCANDFGGDSISDAPSSAAGAHEMFCRTAVLSIGQVLDDSQATIPSMRGGQVFFLCGVVELPRTVECVENRHSPGSLPVSIACSLICVS